MDSCWAFKALLELFVPAVGAAECPAPDPLTLTYELRGCLLSFLETLLC